MSNHPEKKGVSTIDFFCIGFGAIVGVGWAVSINSWMASSGGPVPAALGYLLCLLIMVPFGLVYAELVPMLPVAGGGAAFAYAGPLGIRSPSCPAGQPLAASSSSSPGRPFRSRTFWSISSPS